MPPRVLDPWPEGDVRGEPAMPKPLPRQGNRPTERTEIPTDGNPITRRRATHRSKPPEKGTKEKKTIARGGLPGEILGWVTEAGDFVDALHDALPKWDQAGGTWVPKQGEGRHNGYWLKPSLEKKARAVWNHWDAIDPAKALENLALNQLEDMALGKLGKAAQKASKGWLDQLGRPVGFGTGPTL